MPIEEASVEETSEKKRRPSSVQTKPPKPILINEQRKSGFNSLRKKKLSWGDSNEVLEFRRRGSGESDPGDRQFTDLIVSKY